MTADGTPDLDLEGDEFCLSQPSSSQQSHTLPSILQSLIYTKSQSDLLETGDKSPNHPSSVADKPPSADSQSLVPPSRLTISSIFRPTTSRGTTTLDDIFGGDSSSDDELEDTPAVPPPSVPLRAISHARLLDDALPSDEQIGLLSFDELFPPFVFSPPPIAESTAGATSHPGSPSSQLPSLQKFQMPSNYQETTDFIVLPSGVTATKLNRMRRHILAALASLQFDTPPASALQAVQSQHADLAAVNSTQKVVSFRYQDEEDDEVPSHIRSYSSYPDTGALATLVELGDSSSGESASEFELVIEPPQKPSGVKSGKSEQRHGNAAEQEVLILRSSSSAHGLLDDAQDVPGGGDLLLDPDEEVDLPVPKTLRRSTRSQSSQEPSQEPFHEEARLADMPSTEPREKHLRNDQQKDQDELIDDVDEASEDFEVEETQRLSDDDDTSDLSSHQLEDLSSSQSLRDVSSDSQRRSFYYDSNDHLLSSSDDESSSQATSSDRRQRATLLRQQKKNLQSADVLRSSSSLPLNHMKLLKSNSPSVSDSSDHNSLSRSNRFSLDRRSLKTKSSSITRLVDSLAPEDPKNSERLHAHAQISKATFQTTDLHASQQSKPPNQSTKSKPISRTSSVLGQFFESNNNFGKRE